VRSQHRQIPRTARWCFSNALGPTGVLPTSEHNKRKSPASDGRDANAPRVTEAYTYIASFLPVDTKQKCPIIVLFEWIKTMTLRTSNGSWRKSTGCHQLSPMSRPLGVFERSLRSCGKGCSERWLGANRGCRSARSAREPGIYGRKTGDLRGATWSSGFKPSDRSEATHSLQRQFLERRPDARRCRTTYVGPTSPWESPPGMALLIWRKSLARI